MNPKLQRRVQRYGWDKAAEHYEGFWSRQIRPAQERLLEMAELRFGHHVVDIACGTGLVTIPAAAAVGPTGEVVGTDISDEMIRTAESRGLRNARFARMDAEDLRLDDASFDVALDALGLMYVPDPLQALREMRRVLRPGGRAVACVWGARANCGWADIFPIVDARVDTDVCPMFFQLGTQDVLARTFEAAGFAQVESTRIETRMEYATAQDALGAAFIGGPVAMAYSRFDAPTRIAAHAEYLGSIAPHRVGDGYRIPGEFVVVRGLA